MAFSTNDTGSLASSDQYHSTHDGIYRHCGRTNTDTTDTDTRAVVVHHPQNHLRDELRHHGYIAFIGSVGTRNTTRNTSLLAYDDITQTHL